MGPSQFGPLPGPLAHLPTFAQQVATTNAQNAPKGGGGGSNWVNTPAMQAQQAQSSSDGAAAWASLRAGGGGGGGGGGYSSGGGGGGYSSGPTAAQIAATAKAEQAYHNGIAASDNTINTGIDANAGLYGQSISDAFKGTGGFNSQQRSINDSAIQNELSKAQGNQGVRDMVSNGIQGAGIQLANAGAGTSSAPDAVARAYGVQGRQQASKVGSQFEQGQHTIQTNQDNLNESQNNFVNGSAPAQKQKFISDIVSGATQSLTYLNAQAASASLPDQIDIAQKIADIKARATAALTAFDGQLATNRSANAPTSADANQATAAHLFTAGTAPAHAFDFTASTPAQFQDTGPAASSLPIYVNPNNKTNQPALA